MGGSVSLAGTKSKQQLWVEQVLKWLRQTFSGNKTDANANVTSSLTSSTLDAHLRLSNTDSVAGEQGSAILFQDLRVSGVVPSFAEQCVMPTLDKDVDVVIMELCVNDAFNQAELHTEDKRAIERMIRYILKMPNKPALLMHCVFSAYWAGTACTCQTARARVTQCLLSNTHAAM